MYDSHLSKDGQEFSIMADNRTSRFHAIWLRDNARDVTTRSNENGQRLITLQDISKQLKISEVEIEHDIAHITFQPDGNVISYHIPWLLENSYDRPQAGPAPLIAAGIETWDKKLKQRLPNADYTDVRENAGSLQSWLDQVARFGFGRLYGGPVEDQALINVVDLFGFVRETNYGRYFEVRTQINATNLAYTGLSLQAHTDNPYRDPAPTLQILYCLESTANGGENMVVDGYRVAERLREENSKWFDVLSRYSAQFEYSGEPGVCLQARHPMIDVAPDGELKAIYFNNRSASAPACIPYEKMQTWYAAYRRMSEIIDDPSMEVTFRLNPGECFIVDNTRVLHARKAYSGIGSRWLQGCYADKDGLLSTLACLNRRTPGKPLPADTPEAILI